MPDATSATKLNRENAAVLLVDHQVGLVAGSRYPDPETLCRNTVGLVRAAQILFVPIVATTTMENLLAAGCRANTFRRPRAGRWRPWQPMKEHDMAETNAGERVESLRFINPDGLCDPKPNAYSHLAVFPAGWRMILPAGQGGETEDGTLSKDFRTQLKQALRNTEIVLAAAGANITDVAKFNLLIVDYDEEKFGVVRQEFDRVWGETKPAWTLIPVPALALTGMLVEIDVIAVVPN